MRLEHKLLKEIESYRSLLQKIMIHSKIEIQVMELTYEELVKLVEAIKVMPRRINISIYRKPSGYIVSLKTE